MQRRLPSQRRAAFLISLSLSLGVVAGCDVPDPDDWEVLNTESVPVATPDRADVAYGSLSDRQVLDIYEATTPGHGGVLLFVHGGAWVVGSKDDVPAIALAWRERGWVVVSMGYRLGGEAQWPAQRDDVWAAVRWVRANLAPPSVVVMGHSAGGHIALAGAFSGQPDPAALPDGVVALNAPIAPAEFAATTTLPAGTVNLFMHLTFGCPSASWSQCEPATLDAVDISNAPVPRSIPVYLVAGDSDTTVRWKGGQDAAAERLVVALGATAVWVDLVDSGDARWRGHFTDGGLHFRWLERWMWLVRNGGLDQRDCCLTRFD